MITSNYTFGLSYYVSDRIYSKIGYLFYLVNPEKTMFEKVSKVPRYEQEVSISDPAKGINKNTLKKKFWKIPRYSFAAGRAS